MISIALCVLKSQVHNIGMKTLVYPLTTYSKETLLTFLDNPEPPREARQPRLGPWLDFEKQKTVAAVAAVAERL